MRTISKNIGQLGYDEEVRNSLNDAAIELPLVNSGFTFKGDHDPTISEYPATPTIGDVWVIIGVTGSYTFTTGDLIGRDVVNGNQIVYGTSWSILNYNEISLSEYNSNKALWQNQAVTHNITVDADYTLTTAQNTYGRIIITDTGVLLTGSTNIIVNTIERSFIAQNDTAQTLTFKTSAGTGVAIAAGKSASILCDATDIIIVDSNYSYSKTESDIQRRIYAKETVTHEITTDADYTLTADQNLYGRIVITDTVVTLTGAINIIVDTTEREFIAVNSTAQILTFKTSAGTGIAVGVGRVAILQCDGTNVIVNDTNYSYSKTEIDSSVADRRKLYASEFTTITPSSDADYTLTAGENLFGRLILVDGSWTAAHNIIVDTSIRNIIIDNTSGTYSSTIKTSAGTGIEVKSGDTYKLYNDGTNIILDEKRSIIQEVNISTATNQISFSGLSINKHKSYRIEIDAIEGNASSQAISMLINGLTTTTDYYQQNLKADGASVTSVRGNSAVIGRLSASDRSKIVIFLQKDGAGYVHASSMVTQSTGVSLVLDSFSWNYSAGTVSDITSILFSSGTNAFAANTNARVYRGDL